MGKAYKSITNISTAFIVKFCNTPRHASHKTPKPFLGCCHSCKIAVLNSSIFWHFELCWLIIWPIKSHICTIWFMYGDIACHGIVLNSRLLEKCWPIRALCGLALSSMNIGLSTNAWLLKWEPTRGANTLSLYIWPARLPARTYKFNLQSKGKQPPTPKISCAHNVVDLKWSVLLAPNPCTTVGRA